MSQDGSLRAMLRASGLLMAVALVGTGGVALVHDLTREPIEQRRQEQRLRQIERVLPDERYSNNPAAATVRVRDPRLGTDGPVTAYVARSGGQPQVLILPVTAPDGYNGPIKLLVGIHRDGSVTGVRVLEHSETPGLGDAIEAQRSDWILGFRGRSLDDPPPEDWALRRDGGAFDGLTGASITPRAVIRAVRRALAFYRDGGERVFERQSGAG